MNTIRRINAVFHRQWLEMLLALSIVLLIGQLGWPSAVRWWHLPSPGTVGLDQFQSVTMAERYIVYLPDSYRQHPLWPVVVYLHGSGERGNEPDILKNCEPFRQKLAAIVVAPQCLPTHQWEPDTLAAFIEHVDSTFNVDRQRVYLVGYSMGGFGVWRTATEHPELIAGIVPIAGGGDPSKASNLAKMPIWAFHGAKDDVVGVKQSEQMVEAIRKAGGQPKLTVFPEANHGICDAVCARKDLWEWLFMQSRTGN